MEARLIDVREYPEFAEGHIAGSELVPIGTLDKASEGWDRSAPLTLVCRSGGRAADARQILADKGFTALAVLAGGVQAWTVSGKSLAVAENKPWSMETPGTRHGGRSGADVLRARPVYVEEVLYRRGSGRCGFGLRGCKRHLHHGFRAWPHAVERSGEGERMTPLAIAVASEPKA